MLVVVADGLEDFHSRIKADGGLDRRVAEQPADHLMTSWVVFQIEKSGEVPELVGRQAHPGFPLHGLGDLHAEQSRLLGPFSFAREKPIIAGTDQLRAKFVKIEVEKRDG